MFNNETTKEQAVVTVRFSPKYLSELIEFEVEENAIQLSEYGTPMFPWGRGKDLTVNWKFFDSFDPQGKFYTDSNSL